MKENIKQQPPEAQKQCAVGLLLLLQVFRPSSRYFGPFFLFFSSRSTVLFSSLSDQCCFLILFFLRKIVYSSQDGEKDLEFDFGDEEDEVVGFEDDDVDA